MVARQATYSGSSAFFLFFSFFLPTLLAVLFRGVGEEGGDLPPVCTCLHAQCWAFRTEHGFPVLGCSLHSEPATLTQRGRASLVPRLSTQTAATAVTRKLAAGLWNAPARAASEQRVSFCLDLDMCTRLQGNV